MNFLTLDIKGVLLAIAFGLALLFLGLTLGPFFLLVMIIFLVLSALVTVVGIRYKKGLGLEQEARSIKNVSANGLPPLIMVILYCVSSLLGYSGLALLFFVGFLASVAAITADKFGSEIGVLDGRPRMILTMKRVKKGTSGGITWLGLLAGLIGSLIVALLILFSLGNIGRLGSYYGFSIGKAILIVTVSGFTGTVIDSFLGYYEEKGIGNKFTTNFVCGIAGAAIAMALFVLL